MNCVARFHGSSGCNPGAFPIFQRKAVTGNRRNQPPSPPRTMPFLFRRAKRAWLPTAMVTDPGITTGGDYAQASPKARDGVRGTVTGRVCIFSDFPSLSPLLLVPSHTGILVLLIVSWAGVVGIWGLKNLRQGACHWNKKV